VTLLETYFKVVRPLSDAKQPLTVAVSMALTHIDLVRGCPHFSGSTGFPDVFKTMFFSRCRTKWIRTLSSTVGTAW